MIEWEKASTGLYDSKLGTRHPWLQVLTIEELPRAGRKRGGGCRKKDSYSVIEQIYCIVCFAGKGAMSNANGKFRGC